tara:strand:+ start:620 stop:895 length:276 start_codon:yes stop_codon:yes gene_type:complete
MAILVKLNQVCLHNATLSPILVNLDKVCYIKAYTVPDQDHNVSEGAKLFFDYNEPVVGNNPNEILTFESQREIYLKALSFIELWEKTSDGY